VIVFDEATAALDQDASDRLLHVIATQTANTTVLSIAHRLGVVMQCDRILVLKAGGTFDAFDTPTILAQGDGYFAKQLAAERSGNA
jgi:ABC-type multidrug transport system fused ATPase/permease subunit